MTLKLTIFQAISLDKLITDLNIASNRLGLESSGAVRDLLKLNRLIERLDLSCNNLSLDGGTNILEGLKYNFQLQFGEKNFLTQIQICNISDHVDQLELHFDFIKIYQRVQVCVSGTHVCPQFMSRSSSFQTIQPPLSSFNLLVNAIVLSCVAMRVVLRT